MKKYLMAFISRAESMEKNHTDEDMQELLVHIRFFQHERLVHLIVTIAVAVSLIAIALFIIALRCSLMLFILDMLLLILLVPYILHYYFLENGVQKLYAVYDRSKGIKF